MSDTEKYLASIYRRFCAKRAAKALTQAGRFQAWSLDENDYRLLRRTTRSSPIRVNNRLIIWATNEQKDAYYVSQYNGVNWYEHRCSLEEVAKILTFVADETDCEDGKEEEDDSE